MVAKPTVSSVVTCSPDALRLLYVKQGVENVGVEWDLERLNEVAPTRHGKSSEKMWLAAGAAAFLVAAGLASRSAARACFNQWRAAFFLRTASVPGGLSRRVSLERVPARGRRARMPCVVGGAWSWACPEA